MESSTEFWKKSKVISWQDWILEEMELKGLKLTQVPGFRNRGHGILKQGIVGEMLIWEMDRRYIQFLSSIEAY